LFERDGELHDVDFIDWPFFFAFDVLMVDGEDLRRSPSPRQISAGIRYRFHY
jgi:hypothetical protein